MRKVLEVLAKLFTFLVPVPTPAPVPVRKSYSGLVRYEFAGKTLLGWLAGISGRRVKIGVVYRRGTPGFVERKLHRVELL